MTPENRIKTDAPPQQFTAPTATEPMSVRNPQVETSPQPSETSLKSERLRPEQPVAPPEPAKPIQSRASSETSSAVRTEQPASESVSARPAVASSENAAAASTDPLRADGVAHKEPATVRTLGPRFSAEQIRELQSLVARAVQSARTLENGARETSFVWREESSGPIRFRILSRDDAVSVEIDSHRRDVADLLDGSRVAIERAMNDVGLRVERLDIRLRTGELADPENQGSQQTERDLDPNSQREAQPEWSSSEPNPVEDVLPTTRPTQAEHEWVA